METLLLSSYLERKYSIKLDEDDIKMINPDAPKPKSELADWSIPNGDIISVPDELDPLIKSVSMQIGFLMHSGKGTNKTICDIVWRAHKFFHDYYLPNQKENWDAFEEKFVDEFRNRNITTSNGMGIIRGSKQIFSVTNVLEFIKEHHPVHIQAKEKHLCEHDFVSSVAYKGARICTKCQMLQ